jgi:hypothetical protein
MGVHPYRCMYVCVYIYIHTHMFMCISMYECASPHMYVFVAAILNILSNRKLEILDLYRCIYVCELTEIILPIS